MTQILRQSTAVDVLIGPFLDLTDAATAETGESPSVKLSKNGQTLAAKSDVTTPVHDADGYYNCELDATDTGTVGTLVLTVAASGTALPVRHEYQVVEEATYDRDFAAAATALVTLAAVTHTGAVIPTVTTVNGLAANTITAASIASAALNGKGDWNIGKTGYTLTQAFPANFADLSITATSGLVTLAAVTHTGAVIPTVTSVTNAVDLTAGAVDLILDETLTAHVTADSVAVHLKDILADTTGLNGEAMRGTDNALLAASAPTNFSAMSITVGGLVDITQAAADKVWSSATRTLTAFSTALAVSVWDVLESAIVTASSIGLKVKNNLDAAVTTRATPAQVNTEVDNALDTAIPGVPTANSINERIKAIDDKLPTGNISDFDEATDNVTLAAVVHTGATIPTVTDVTNRVTANTDQLNADATALQNLEASTETIIRVTALTGSTNTTIETGLTEATNDHYKGRVVIFRTGVLAGQASDITAYNGTSKALTVTAMTDAPGNGDLFVIV